MELERVGIWMSRVAHISLSPDTMLVYRISLVLGGRRCFEQGALRHGSRREWAVDSESLRDIWPPPTDDIIFLLSVVGRTSETLCGLNWEPRSLGSFPRSFTIEEYCGVLPIFFKNLLEALFLKQLYGSLLY